MRRFCHGPSKSFGIGALLAILVLEAGCMHLNEFSTRATQFNVQVAASQNETLLLNIVRASKRFPMHFSELSTLSGTGTITESGTLTIPFGSINGGMNNNSIAGTPSISESPTFNVAVLETQEFYQGMLKKLPLEQLATYVNEGVQPELMLMLGIGEIEYRESKAKPSILIENNFHPIVVPRPDATAAPLSCDPFTSQYECFREVLRVLLIKGLTLEETKDVSNTGPLVGQDSFRDLRWVEQMDAKKFKVATVSWDDCPDIPALKDPKKPNSTDDDAKPVSEACPEGRNALPSPQQDTLKAGGRLYRVQAIESDWRFCFDEPRGQQLQEAVQFQPPRSAIGQRLLALKIPEGSKCQYLAEKSKQLPKAQRTQGSKLAFFDEERARKAKDISDKAVDSKAQSDQKDKDPKYTLDLHIRSTEGVIYYLGEIARCDFELNAKKPTNQASDSNPESPTPDACVMPTIRVPYRSPAHQEDDLFKVSELAQRPSGAISAESVDGKIAVDWNERRYEIEIDPSAQNRSGQVLRILTQLLALNRAAKDFPAPAIVPIITH
jgi:hypothetical protein